MRLLISLIVLIIFSKCSRKSSNEDSTFELVQSSHSGVQFENRLEYNEHLNTYTYRNFYNGAGVALGDINNDGLLDIYFSGNQVDNKLYLNKGNFQFEDITIAAGVSCSQVWSTGVSMVDVNGDGFLDIFVCKSGPPLGGVRHNELFINNGDLTFTESSVQWGVADEGLSIHAVFFDYDKDGDLDFYLLNNSNRSVGIYDLREGQREIRDPFGGNKMYRNDGNFFTDVSEKTGIYGSAIGFGLGVTIGDLNKDGWQDIFVSNDFFERDYLYINNQDGTFTESLESLINEISLGSMGADIADLDNDGYPEIYVTEMLPESLDRVRTKTLFEDWDKYSANIKGGYHRQFTRNVLQFNNGPVPGSDNTVSFSEISRFAGVDATDWSWGALIFDYNNDGYKDIFVANGIAKDLTDQDYINFEVSNMLTASNLKKDSMLLTKLIDTIPSFPIRNYLFENNGSLKFTNKAEALGLSFEGFSNGSAFGDLDNDGFLDLVINNVNAPASIYKNQSNSREKNNFLQIKLEGVGLNSFAIGAQATLYCGNEKFYIEQNPVRGYLSSIDPKLHIGIGKHTLIDSLYIRWNDGLVSIIRNVIPNQLLVIQENSISKASIKDEPTNRDVYFNRSQSLLTSVLHAGSSFNDFNRDRLLFEMISNEGPGLAIGDVNNDGLDDIFVGGAINQPGSLWLQKMNGEFIQSNKMVFEQDKRAEDIKAVFFDANGDGSLDLYVASGGNYFSYGSPDLKDRLYLNDGSGNFTKTSQIIETGDLAESTAFVVNLDFDGDGRQDLIVGSRLIPFFYGYPANAYLLRNVGNGMFLDVTKERAIAFMGLGMLRDAVVFDMDRDGDTDVILCGEWMPLKIFRNDNGYFKDISNAMGFEHTHGLWNVVEMGDFDNDGFIDIIAGNHGLNSRYTASADEPLVLYTHDFDGNGSAEHLICKSINGEDYPLALLPDLWKQIPTIKKKFFSFDSYKDASITDLFDKSIIEKATILKVSKLDTRLFLNKKGKYFKPMDLPQQIQYTKLYSIHAVDCNRDGNLDLIVGGNQRRSKPEQGIQDASYGQVFLGKGDGNFTYIPQAESGMFVKGEIRDLKSLLISGEQHLVISRFDDVLCLYKFTQN